MNIWSHYKPISTILIELETAGHQWLTHVILATQEAEIRRIVVQSQPGRQFCETLSRKYPSQKKGWWSG
jgi:hypothetical protein